MKKKFYSVKAQAKDEFEKCNKINNYMNKTIISNHKLIIKLVVLISI